jgi:ABC-type multidrug transport system fused ATPase/permease subunit
VIGLAEPWPLASVVDHVLSPHASHRAGHLFFIIPASASNGALILSAAVLLVVLVGLSALADFGSTFLMDGAGQRIGNDIRGDVFAHLQRLSLRFHVRQTVGDLTSRVTGDVDRLQDLMVQALAVLVPNVLLVVGMLIVMVVVDPVFALLSLLVVPVMIWSIHRSTHEMKRASRLARAKDGDVAGVVSETLGAMQVIQTYSLESSTTEQFRTSALASLKANLTAIRHQARLGPLVDLTGAVARAAVIGVGAQRVLSGHMTLGVLLVFLAYLAKLYVPVKALSKLTFNISRGEACGERVDSLLRTEIDVLDRADAQLAPPMCGQVAFRDVSFAYGQEPVLRSVSFTVQQGETVAIVGPTGSGKSTIASLIPRLFDPDQGSVMIDGYDLRELSVGSLRRQIAMVLQESILFRSSLWNNIACGRPGVTDAEVWNAVKLARVDEFLDRLPDGLHTVLGERGADLSGGQRQRVAIARAIVRNSPILILDEPTSALDAKSEAVVVEALENLMRGRTTIIIAHRLSTVRRADRIIVLEHGTIVEQGSHTELLAAGGLYSTLSRLQHSEV